MKKKGISLITLVITIIVVMILAAAIIYAMAKNNPMKQANEAVFKQDIAVMQDVLNLAIGDITLECQEPPVLYMDEGYTQIVTDRVWINQDSDEIGKLYYTASTEKGCIIFGKGEDVETNEMKYRYTDQELPTYQGKKLKWYVTHTNRIVLDVKDVNADKMNKPGTYKMTVNAGNVAQWLGIEVKGLVIPEGARVEYSFEASDDRLNYDEAVSKIENARNSQYLRVKITLIANEEGKSPSLSSVKIRFKVSDDILVEEPVLENMKETEEMGQTVYELEEGKEQGKVSQVIDFGEKYQETNTNQTKIEVPIIKDHKMDYLGKDKTSVDGASLNFYVSDDGKNWTKVEPDRVTNHRYVKVETVVTDPTIKVGKVQVNANDQEAEREEVSDEGWVTYQTQYYEYDAGGIGEWISCETDETLQEGTRIKYTFSKSNDEKNYTDYAEDITANGNSRYIKVKVEFQREKKNNANEATLNDIVVSYKVDGMINYNSMDGKGLVQVARTARLQDQEYYRIHINGQDYLAHAYVYEGNQTWEDMTFGDSNDVATAEEHAKHMIIVKVKGNLTIRENATITNYLDTAGYGAPKGLLLCVTGTLTNYGTISLTGKGAYHDGEDVYLWKNKDDAVNPYELIPKVGGNGGAGAYQASTASIAGNPGGNGGVGGSDRKTGGGGGGAVMTDRSHQKLTSSRGSAGTSYNGGSGSAAVTGVGNAAGAKYGGGLLVIYANRVINHKTIESNGVTGGIKNNSGKTASSGASGGGSINIFYQSQYENLGTITVNGGPRRSATYIGGAGGAGTITTGNIASGTFVKDE